MENRKVVVRPGPGTEVEVAEVVGEVADHLKIRIRGQVLLVDSSREDIILGSADVPLESGRLLVLSGGDSVAVTGENKGAYRVRMRGPFGLFSYTAWIGKYLSGAKPIFVGN